MKRFRKTNGQQIFITSIICFSIRERSFWLAIFFYFFTLWFLVHKHIIAASHISKIWCASSRYFTREKKPFLYTYNKPLLYSIRQNQECEDKGRDANRTYYRVHRKKTIELVGTYKLNEGTQTRWDKFGRQGHRWQKKEEDQEKDGTKSLKIF